MRSSQTLGLKILQWLSRSPDPAVQLLRESVRLAAAVAVTTTVHVAFQAVIEANAWIMSGVLHRPDPSSNPILRWLDQASAFAVHSVADVALMLLTARVLVFILRPGAKAARAAMISVFQTPVTEWP